MINEDKRFIFTHNPKTGGSAVKRYLNGLNLSFKRGDWHYSTEQLCGYADRDYTDYFKFGTCRNPFSRLVSAFVYNCRNCSNPHDYNWKRYPDSFAVLKKWVSFDGGDLVNNFRYFVKSEDFSKIFDNRWPIHFRQQFRFFTPKHLDFVIRYENLNQDFQKALEKIGYISHQNLPLVNSSDHLPYREFYDIETMQLVVNKYREDFNIFGYNPLFLGQE